MVDVELIRLGAIVVIATVALLWMIPVKCKHGCPACDRDRVEAIKRHKEVQHDAEHKGFGFRAEDLDRFSCHDDSCPRNLPPRGREDDRR
jgi:hypothetical protein